MKLNKILTSLVLCVGIIFVVWFMFTQQFIGVNRQGVTSQDNGSQYLNKEQMIEKAKESLLNRWSDTVIKSELEIMYFETSICIYDEDGQLIRSNSCWSIGNQSESVKNEINGIQGSDSENLYYISFEFKDKTMHQGGCDVVGGSVLITDKGRVIHAEDVVLCVDIPFDQ